VAARVERATSRTPSSGARQRRLESLASFEVREEQVKAALGVGVRSEERPPLAQIRSSETVRVPSKPRTLPLGQKDTGPAWTLKGWGDGV